MRISRAAAIWLIFAFFAGIAPTGAQTSRAKPGHIDLTSASSPCIGQATTAACAVETLLACLARNDEGLCARVGAALGPRGEPQRIDYAIETMSVIRPEDVDQDMQDLDWYKPGYTLAEVARRVCAADASSCEDKSWHDLQVYLRRGGSGAWIVVTWRGGDDEAPPDQPELTRSE